MERLLYFNWCASGFLSETIVYFTACDETEKKIVFEYQLD